MDTIVDDPKISAYGYYKAFAAREGNPFSLLEDDEQDIICEILERL